MAFHKSYLYNDTDRQISFFARALGHPARLAIIRQLIHEGPCTVAMIVQFHPISQPTISQHLEFLRKLHLISFTEKFPHTYYSINAKQAIKLKRYLNTFLKVI